MTNQHRKNTVILSAWVLPALRDDAREEARLAGIPFSEFIERAVRQAVSKRNAPAVVPAERVEALLRGARVRLENWACHMATGYERGRSEVAVFTLELLGELFPTAKPDAGGGG